MEPKFKLGDIVDCTNDDVGFEDWKNAKVIEVVDLGDGKFGYTCTCEKYGDEHGLLWEYELELTKVEANV